MYNNSRAELQMSQIVQSLNLSLGGIAMCETYHIYVCI